MAFSITEGLFILYHTYIYDIPSDPTLMYQYTHHTAPTYFSYRSMAEAYAGNEGGFGVILSMSGIGGEQCCRELGGDCFDWVPSAWGSEAQIALDRIVSEVLDTVGAATVPAVDASSSSSSSSTGSQMPSRLLVKEWQEVPYRAIPDYDSHVRRIVTFDGKIKSVAGCSGQQIQKQQTHQHYRNLLYTYLLYSIFICLLPLTH